MPSQSLSNKSYPCANSAGTGIFNRAGEPEGPHWELTFA